LISGQAAVESAERVVVTVAVRSDLLASGLAPASSNVLVATVPAAETWLVKDALIYNPGGSAELGVLYVQSVDSSINVGFIAETVSAGGVAHFSGFVVMQPGQKMYFANGPGVLSFWVSGAKLLGTAT
jgi:hypothetical protein